MPEAVFYFMMEAVPNESNEEDRDCGGAFINCWVRAENEEKARERARRFVKAERWTFISEEEASPARRDMYRDDPETLECFDEACEYGLSACFYSWPREQTQ